MVTREELKRSARREGKALIVLAAIAAAYVLGGFGSDCWRSIHDALNWGAR